MALRDLLTLTTVTITKKTETSDGMGGVTTSSVISTMPSAMIWGAGTSKGLLSEKIANISTHVLALVTGDYTFSYGSGISYTVGYNSNTYTMQGHDDDIMQKGELTIVGLERIT